MRAIKTLSDVQIVLNQHDNFITGFNAKDLDRKGLKVVNNGDGTNPQDYATVSQLNKAIAAIAPSPVSEIQQHYTMVFTEDGVVTTGMIIPAFIAGFERTGIPIAMKVVCRGAPSGGDLTVNFYVGKDLLTGGPILQSDLIFPAGSSAVVSSSNFVNPLPYVGTDMVVFPLITNGAGANGVTMELLLKRSKNAGA